MQGVRRTSSTEAAEGSSLEEHLSTIIDIEPDVPAHERTPLLQDSTQQRSGKLSYGSDQRFEDNSCGHSDVSTSNASSNSTCSNSSSYKRSAKLLPLCLHLRLAAFLLLLFTGCIIATYLLIAETRLPVMRFSLDLVHHDIWSNMALPFAGLLNYSNVLNIVIMQTGGEGCEKPSACMGILKELQAQHLNVKEATPIEVPYNFLIGGDGQAYEARGWNYESGNALVPQNTSLVIGFIGNYTYKAPSAIQLRSALSLITESIRRKKLQRKYKIYGVRNLTISELDGEALYSSVRQWPQFVSLVQVL